MGGGHEEEEESFLMRRSSPPGSHIYLIMGGRKASRNKRWRKRRRAGDEMMGKRVEEPHDLHPFPGRRRKTLYLLDLSAHLSLGVIKHKLHREGGDRCCCRHSLPPAGCSRGETRKSERGGRGRVKSLSLSLPLCSCVDRPQPLSPPVSEQPSVCSHPPVCVGISIALSQVRIRPENHGFKNVSAR